MDAVSMGQRTNIDQPWVDLIAGVFQQAAWDYRYGTAWLKNHPELQRTKEFKETEELVAGVIDFTRSDLFELALDMKPEQFLRLALQGKIKNRRYVR